MGRVPARRAPVLWVAGEERGGEVTESAAGNSEGAPLGERFEQARTVVVGRLDGEVFWQFCGARQPLDLEPKLTGGDGGEDIGGVGAARKELLNEVCHKLGWWRRRRGCR